MRASFIIVCVVIQELLFPISIFAESPEAQSELRESLKEFTLVVPAESALYKKSLSLRAGEKTDPALAGDLVKGQIRGMEQLAYVLLSEAKRVKNQDMSEHKKLEDLLDTLLRLNIVSDKMVTGLVEMFEMQKRERPSK